MVGWLSQALNPLIQPHLVSIAIKLVAKYFLLHLHLHLAQGLLLLTLCLAITGAAQAHRLQTARHLFIAITFLCCLAATLYILHTLALHRHKSLQVAPYNLVPSVVLLSWTDVVRYSRSGIRRCWGLPTPASTGRWPSPGPLGAPSTGRRAMWAGDHSS